MKEFTFPVWCRFGPCDSGDSLVIVELTDEEAEKLEKFGTQAEIYYNEFSNCKELNDLYKNVYSIAVAQTTEELKEFADWLAEKYLNDPEWKADDIYKIDVNFPNEFEDVLIEADEGTGNEKVF
jgi:hypothetical protein